jgi:hypothetical protein
MIFTNSSTYFYIKNLFLFNSLNFLLSWTRRTKPEKSRGLEVRICRHRAQLQWKVGSIPRKPRVSYAKMPDRRGMIAPRPPDQTRPIQIKSRTGIPQQPHDLRSTVGDRPSHQHSLDCRIAHRRFGFKTTKGYPLI